MQNSELNRARRLLLVWSCRVLYRIFRQRGENMFRYCDIIACVRTPILRGSGGMPPRKILNFTTSKAASGDFLPHTHFGY